MKKIVWDSLIFVTIVVVPLIYFAEPPVLPNLGSSCYMDAVIECLYNITPLTAYLKQETTKPTNKFVQFYQQFVKNPNDILVLKNLYAEVQLQMSYSAFLNWIKENLQQEYAREDFNFERVDTLLKNEIEVYKKATDPEMARAKPDVIKFLENEINGLNKIKTSLMVYGGAIGTLKSILGEALYNQLVHTEPQISKELLKAKLTTFVGEKGEKLEDKFRDFIGASAERCVQQDAGELFGKIFINFSADTAVAQEFKKMIMFAQQKRSKCADVEKIYETLDEGPVSELAIEDKASNVLTDLYAILHYGTSWQKDKDDDPCSYRDQYVKLGNSFIIGLKRSFAILDSVQNVINRKIDNLIDIPFQLDMRSYTVPGTVDPITCAYNLSSVIRHIGGATGGHYIAYVKDQGQWYVCDDIATQKVAKMSEKEVEQEIKNGVIFFYERMSLNEATIFLANRDINNLAKALRGITSA